MILLAPRFTVPTVTIRYFAVLRERRGTDTESMSVPQGCTLAELYHQVFPPGPHGSLPIAYARNEEYASSEDVISDGDEIVFLPPLGGG